ncbi:hypothetical protein GCM10010468_55660 [Actinocorallia longicatena]|uniref:Uncharacterized protein n=1 Tax=Actinocorallia longicatena TaxID=111803 RepID=A0ABP6QFQ0_9ACTN
MQKLADHTQRQGAFRGRARRLQEQGSRRGHMFTERPEQSALPDARRPSDQRDARLTRYTCLVVLEESRHFSAVFPKFHVCVTPDADRRPLVQAAHYPAIVRP